MIACSKSSNNFYTKHKSDSNINAEQQYSYLKNWPNAEHSILILLPLSGANAEIGRNTLNTCLIAARDYANINFVVVDTADANLNTSELYNRFKDEKLDAIIGPVFYDEAKQFSAVFSKVPTFSLSNNIRMNNSHVFACGLSPAEELKCLFQTIKNMNGVLVMLPENSYGDELVKLINNEASRYGIDNDSIETIRYSQVDKQEAMDMVNHSDKQAIFIIDPILNISSLNDKYIFTLAAIALSNKNAWEGAIFASCDSEWRKNFLQIYHKQLKLIPTTIDMVAYDIISALCRSLNDHTDLYSTEHPGCFGEFVINPKKGIQRKLQPYVIEQATEVPFVYGDDQ